MNILDLQQATSPSERKHNDLSATSAVEENRIQWKVIKLIDQDRTIMCCSSDEDSLTRGSLRFSWIKTCTQVDTKHCSCK